MILSNNSDDIRKKQVSDREIRPAGVFYYTIDNPFIEKDEKIALSMQGVEGDNSCIEKGILNSLTMKGIVNSDPEIIQKIDDIIVDENGKLVPSMKSEVIKLSTNTKGDIRAGANCINDEEFVTLINKTRDIIKDNKFAVVTMAGGQGTRLRTSRTKRYIQN